MAKIRVNVTGGQPLFDFRSDGKGGLTHRDQFSPAQIAYISRTAGRAPEVMVKVTRGATNRRSLTAHFNYISRNGDLDLETDDGERLTNRDAGEQLIEDWNLDLEEHRRRSDLFAVERRQAPKLVHKVIFSMPEGTPPKKVLAAVHDFAREEFGGKHRYALVLHTDERHPHVHLVVKAVSEQGVRLSIHRGTLQHWRQEFARHLRARGVEANATSRRVRGQSRAPKLDSIFRAAQRGESSHMIARVQAVVRELKAGSLDRTGADKLQRTRSEVVRGWNAVRERLLAEGRHQLAEQVSKFVIQMLPPRTEKQWLASELIARARSIDGAGRARNAGRDPDPPTR